MTNHVILVMIQMNRKKHSGVKQYLNLKNRTKCIKI